MLARLEEAMLEERPDLVMVLGDTNSTLAGALAAAKLGIPIAHVEAGLRSFDMSMPEEINRRVVDHLSALLYCPTRAAVENLGREGVTRGVRLVGDVMLDAVLQHRARAERLPAGGEPPRASYYLATVHRQENTDDPRRLASLLGALASLPRPVLFPVHPRTRARIAEQRQAPSGSLRLLPPQPYLRMLRLASGARAVLTDSGGLQKEAFILGVPCVTLRDTTEWVETLAAGANRLAGASPERIRRAVARIEAERPRRAPLRAYGGGRASERIAAGVTRFLGARRAAGGA
jgi:UDP-N-acetylglucosamine 2-epimerase